MDPVALRAFARRDWGQLAEAKTAFWIEQGSSSIWPGHWDASRSRGTSSASRRGRSYTFVE